MLRFFIRETYLLLKMLSIGTFTDFEFVIKFTFTWQTHRQKYACRGFTTVSVPKVAILSRFGGTFTIITHSPLCYNVYVIVDCCESSIRSLGGPHRSDGNRARGSTPVMWPRLTEVTDGLTQRWGMVPAFVAPRYTSALPLFDSTEARRRCISI